MKAAELEAHPEFPYLTWDLKPSKKAKLPAAAKRGGPLNIAYEVHGHGPRTMVVSLISLFYWSSRGSRILVHPEDHPFVLGQQRSVSYDTVQL